MKYLNRILTFVFLFFVFQSTYAQEWKQLGPFEPTIPLVDSGKMTPHGVGRLHSIVLLNKKGKQMMVGSSTGGTFITKNYGKTWTSNYNYPYMSGANAILKFSRKHYWIATCSNHLPTQHWGLGVIETKDRGQTWNATGFEKYPEEYDLCCLYDMVVNPKDKKHVFILSESKVWQTKDKGETWTIVFEDDKANFRNIVIADNNPNLVFLLGKKVFKSIDGGVNFKEITSNLLSQMPQNKSERFVLTFFGKKQETLFAMGFGNFTSVLRSDDLGETWTLTNASVGAFSNNQFGIWSFNYKKTDYLLMGGIRAYLSADSGKTSKQITFPTLTPNYVHDDIRDVAFGKKGRIYLAHDGGLAMSKDLGVTWTDLSGKGLTVTQFYGLSNSEQAPYYFVAGTLDMSTKIYNNGTWYCLSSIYADGGRGRMHPTDSNQIYISGSGYAYRYDSLTNKWRYAHPFTKRADFDFSMDFDKEGNNFFMVNDHIWRIRGGEQVWENITRGLPAHRDISTLALSPHNPNEIWFARKEQTWSEENLKEKLYYSPDGGKSWLDKTANLPVLAWRHVRHLHVSTEKQGVIYAGLGNFDSNKPGSSINKVFVSQDNGDTWKNISEGLPNFPVNFITTFKSYVFAATDVGVYVLKPGSSQWEIYGQGLPPVVTTEIHVNHTASKLRCSTFGRGMWEVDLP